MAKPSELLLDYLTEADRSLPAFAKFPIVQVNLTCRHAFVASQGYIFGDWDFENQEMVTAAVESGDPNMLGAFKKETPKQKTILLPGNETPLIYTNPATDLHTLTIASCYPEVFRGCAEWELVNKAKTTEPGKKKSYRDIGKIVNFGSLFQQTVEAMAKVNHVVVAEAKRWHDGHRAAYPVFHEWGERMAHIGSARGWIETTWGGRIRWVCL